MRGWRGSWHLLIRIYGDQAEIMDGNQEHSQLQTRHVKALGASSDWDCLSLPVCHGGPIVSDASWSNYNLICVGLGPIINYSHKRALKNHFIEVGGRYRICTVHGAEL